MYDSLGQNLSKIVTLSNGLRSHDCAGITEVKSTQIAVDIRLEVASVQ